MPIWLRKLSRVTSRTSWPDQQLALGDIIKPGNQSNDRRLAGARRPDDGNRLAGLGLQTDAIQHRLVSFIQKVNIFENAAAFNGRHLDGVRFVLDVEFDVYEAKDALAPGNRVLNVGPRLRLFARRPSSGIGWEVRERGRRQRIRLQCR